MYRALVGVELGWSRDLVAGAFAVGALAAIPTSFLASWATDRWGAPVIVAAGTAMLAVALLGGALTTSPWHWYATAGILLAVGVRTILAGTSVLASLRPRRGRSLGLTQGAVGAGLILGPSAAQAMLDHVGWRAMLAVAGAGCMALALVATSRASHVAPAGHTTAAAGSTAGPARVALLVGHFLGNVLLGIYDEVVYQHTYAHGLALGLGTAAAAGVISLVSLTYTVGSVLGGALSDHLGRRVVLVGTALASGLALLFMALSTSTTLWIMGAVFGLMLGATVTVRSAAWADAFEGARLGRDIGLVAPGYLVGAAAATWGGARWLEHGGGFVGLYVAAALAAFAWALLGGALTHGPAIPRGP